MTYDTVYSGRHALYSIITSSILIIYVFSGLFIVWEIIFLKEGSLNKLMVRNLYRFYLYLVYIGMLGFAAAGLAMLLQLLFAFTSLRGGSPVPTHAGVVQAITYAAVSLVIAIPLWAVHYWLIRRDMRTDPAAGSGGVRSFFLNFAEAISLLLGVFIGSSVISSLAQPYVVEVTGNLAFSIVTLAIFVLLEWERRRSGRDTSGGRDQSSPYAAPGAAIIFQRIHIFGVQAILLIGLTFSWFSTVGQMLDSTLPVSIVGFHFNLLSEVASTIWIALFWLGYCLLGRRDTPSHARQIIHYVGFAYGVGMTLVGINFLLQLALQTILKASVLPIDRPSAHFSFVAPLTFGFMVIIVYSLLLRIFERGSQATSFSISEVITTALQAVSFWVGCGYLLYSGFEHLADPSPSDLSNLVIGLSALIPGIAYIPLSLHLSRRRSQTTVVGPRRALVFGLLTGGTLVSVGSAITLLYMLLTSLLGSPINNAQEILHGAAAGLIVGLLVVGIYLWTARREHLIGARPQPAASIESKEIAVPASTSVDTSVTPSTMEPVSTASEMPSSAQPATTSIEDILDELQDGKLTRDEAAARIRELTSQVKG